MEFMNTYGCMVEKGHEIHLYCIFTAIVTLYGEQSPELNKGLRE